jgi:4-aminobutyrate aminotransferase/(S)-3-amino-2-methylpropionate transaminase
VFESYRPRGAFRSHDPHAQLVFERAQGDRIWDSQGREYIDCIGGYSSLNLGHSHPHLVATAISQMEELSYCTGGSSRLRWDVEQQLSLLLEGKANGDVKVWLSTTGSRAVEIAWKIAYAQRPGGIMRFDLGYHGRSLATAEISDTASSDALYYQATSRDRVPRQRWLVPYPRCGSQCIGNCPECNRSIACAEEHLSREATHISAMIVEPAIGSRGYYFASPGYYRRLEKLLRDHQVLLVSDEIQMGLGRLGSMLVSVSDGWTPDMVIVGKSLGGGLLPISAVIGRSDIMDRLPEGIESETFVASPLACRIAIEVLRLLNQPAFLNKILEHGILFRDMLRDKIPQGVLVDGRGMATVLDLSRMGGNARAKHTVGNMAKPTGLESIAWNCVEHARERGVLVHLTGEQRNRIAILPPLIVEQSTLVHVASVIGSFWKEEKEE